MIYPVFGSIVLFGMTIVMFQLQKAGFYYPLIDSNIKQHIGFILFILQNLNMR